jgi:hypothetical protein
LSGIEGLFFARESAEAKGFEVGSNYQRQSAIALLSYAVIAVLIWFIKWGIKAELTIFMAFIFFFFFFSIEPCGGCDQTENLQMAEYKPPFSPAAPDCRDDLSVCDGLEESVTV